MAVSVPLVLREEGKKLLVLAFDSSYVHLNISNSVHGLMVRQAQDLPI